MYINFYLNMYITKMIVGAIVILIACVSQGGGACVGLCSC